MKYFDMLTAFEFVNELRQAAEKKDPSTYQQPVIEKPVEKHVEDTRKEDEEEMLSLLREIKEKINVPENVDPSTILNEKEANALLDILIMLEKNVFTETPLSRDLVTQFIWNLPRPFYEMAMRNFKQNKPPCMNPMYWFYMFCIDLDGLNPRMQDNAFADAVCTAASMEDDDFAMLVDNATKYQDTLSSEIPD